MNVNAENWMGRLRLTAAECNYKEIDRQLKEQCIHMLNDDDMPVEIIRELTKAKESTAVTSKQALVCVERVIAKRQRAQSAIITSLIEVKVFDKIRQ